MSFKYFIYGTNKLYRNLGLVCVLAVEASLTGDPRKVFHAICFDPLTSAVLSLEEIKQMVDEMFTANRDYLPQFKHFS
jgi:alpha-galactosidase